MNFFKYINRHNNHERCSSYIDILVNRTLYMSCQAGPGIEPGPSALEASALPIEITWQLAINLMIVPGILVCSSCLISVCMFIVSGSPVILLFPTFCLPHAVSKYRELLLSVCITCTIIKVNI